MSRVGVEEQTAFMADKGAYNGGGESSRQGQMQIEGSEGEW